MAENDPPMFRRVPVGNHVVYHGRSGSMRQGRTSFPAQVLQQHPDDGSLDLIVEYEAEDRIWEQRVRPWSEAQPGHCWTLVEPIGPDPGEDDDVALDLIVGKLAILAEDIDKLRRQMYGEYEAPPDSMIQYLDGFDKRIKELEKKLRK